MDAIHIKNTHPSILVSSPYMDTSIHIKNTPVYIGEFTLYGYKYTHQKHSRLYWWVYLIWMQYTSKTHTRLYWWVHLIWIQVYTSKTLPSILVSIPYMDAIHIKNTHPSILVSLPYMDTSIYIKNTPVYIGEFTLYGYKYIHQKHSHLYWWVHLIWIQVYTSKTLPSILVSLPYMDTSIYIKNTPVYIS